jgi:hypothetical protein
MLVDYFAQLEIWISKRTNDGDSVLINLPAKMI